MAKKTCDHAHNEPSRETSRMIPKKAAPATTKADPTASAGKVKLPRKTDPANSAGKVMKADPTKLGEKVFIPRKLNVPRRLLPRVPPFDPEDPFDCLQAEKETQKLRKAREREERSERTREYELQFQKNKAEAKQVIERLRIRTKIEFLDMSEVEIILSYANLTSDEWKRRRRTIGVILFALEQCDETKNSVWDKDNLRLQHRWLQECIENNPELKPAE